jgi:chromosome partitioning protein
MKTSKFTKNGAESAIATATSMRQARPTVAAPAKPYGPRQIADTVTFLASFPRAKAVLIAGDFNNWKPEKTPMTKIGNDDWQAKITLSKGVYKYRFVVDGKWQHDPANDMTEANPYGELNSVLKVS